MSGEPREVYLVLHDGERVPCLLELVEPNHWQATPVRKVAPDEVAGGAVDVLPEGGTLDFLFEKEEA